MALAALEAWKYFDSDKEDEAIAALRDRMGAAYASSPTDDALGLILQRAAEYLHRATGRFFVAVEGTIDVSGTGEGRLFLPFPVVSADQVSGATVSILVDGSTDPIDETMYAVNAGARPGPEDPRDNPFVEFVPYDSVPSSPPFAEWATAAVFPYGVQNLHITATWGYLDEDGATPESILYWLSRVCVLNAVEAADFDGQEDKRRAALGSEQTESRSWSWRPHAAGAGITLDRELDSIVKMFRRPPRAIVGRPVRRAYRRNRGNQFFLSR